MKTIKRIKKTVKMGVVLSIAAIALSVYSASSASALPVPPSLDEDIMIELDDSIFDEELIPLFGTDVDVEATGCLPSYMGPERIDFTITNNNDGPKRYEIFVYDGVIEASETPEFTFPEEATGSDSEIIWDGETHEFPSYFGSFFSLETPTVVRVQIIESYLPAPVGVGEVIFDQEIIVCEYDAEQMLSEAAEEYAAAVALAEAEAEAEAAAQAQAEAEAQATAEAEELEAELADAEEAAAEAQAALDSMIEAVSVDIESDSQETPSSNESTETASKNQPLVDGEQAIGDSLPENTDNSGLPIAMIIVVTLIGLLGLAAAGTAALNMNR